MDPGSSWGPGSPPSHHPSLSLPVSEHLRLKVGLGWGSPRQGDPPRVRACASPHCSICVLSTCTKVMRPSRLQTTCTRTLSSLLLRVLELTKPRRQKPVMGLSFTRASDTTAPQDLNCNGKRLCHAAHKFSSITTRFRWVASPNSNMCLRPSDNLLASAK